MDITFAADEIRFVAYPFVGASVYPAGVLPVADIRDVDVSAWPPEIRTRAGETVFVHGGSRAELAEFCRRNGVVEVYRVDVWADLLEPFLDTQFDATHEDFTLSRLRSVGFSAGEVAEIRARVGPLMESYNFDTMLWEWVHLGLHDLLSALVWSRVSRRARRSLGDPAEVYRWAMAIAERGA
ncbi:hypothetical protein GCM10011591_03610 [Nocardia camponoti]|uniref:Uncharacterized protein n=1 Tax=Nocardia camponoti TaxID=1616106 RepID=A0A917V4G1_9NOCA|nr:hypothetical protein GCM10011591_03610 [Nocardia camponoti]